MEEEKVAEKRTMMSNLANGYFSGRWKSVKLTTKVSVVTLLYNIIKHFLLLLVCNPIFWRKYNIESKPKIFIQTYGISILQW